MTSLSPKFTHSHGWIRACLRSTLNLSLLSSALYSKLVSKLLLSTMVPDSHYF
ncbi:hypothetical protein OIU74_027974 [Salix koriyanagi]|uniref:Uncharacterized protein n=1 Tax=Salix koriyanagi TaxID=2511006 RepID=A0A9Q0VBA7_9ROSI|nr:hypothetical protein OIU74_027974 [Salix koriyanagi]